MLEEPFENVVVVSLVERKYPDVPDGRKEVEPVVVVVELLSVVLFGLKVDPNLDVKALTVPP